MAEASRIDDGGLVTVTFTRDEKLNAVSPAMLDVLRDAVEDLGAREDLGVLLIRAEGRHFTAGLDITSMSGEEGISSSTSGVALRHEYRRLHRLLDDLESVEKPVIIATQGPSRGLGVELAASCDFRLSSDRAFFELPEITNLAVLPGSGGISRLTRLVGPHWARWLAMAGQRVDAAQALTIGFVHAVYPAAEFESSVQAFAQHLLTLSPEALGLAKLTIDSATSADRASARDFDRVANTLLMGAPDNLERIQAFSQPRDAR